MRNDTESKIVLTFRNIDNANRLKKCLTKFFEIADMGGDINLLIDQNGKIQDCGFVAHDLIIRKIEHIIGDMC